MHFQPRRDTRHVGSRQGVKRHRFERWKCVVARRPRNGHKFERPRPRFAPCGEGDFVRHLGLEHLEFRGPSELRFPQEFQVSTAFVGDFQRDGFVRGDAVCGQGLGHIQSRESADRVSRCSLRQGEDFNADRVAGGLDVAALKEVDAQVAREVKITQRERARLLREGHDLPHRGHVVSLAVDQLRFPPRIWGLHRFFPKSFELWNVVVPDVEVGVPVVNLVGEYQWFAEVHGALARFDGRNQIALNHLGLRP